MKVIRCGVRYFCFGALLIFVGSILLISFGLTVVLPYEATKDWPMVNCTVILSGYNADLCSCTQQLIEYEDCIQSYPCLQVYVSYILATNMNSTLETSQGSIQDKANTLVERRPKSNKVSLTGTSEREIVKSEKYVQRSIKDSKVRVPEKRSEHSTSQHMDQFRNSNRYIDLFGVRTHRETRSLINGHLSSDKTNGMTSISHKHRRHKHISKANHMQSSRLIVKEHSDLFSYAVSTKSGQIPTVNLTIDNSQVLMYGMLYRSWGDAFYNTCSIHECGVEEWNVKESRRFKLHNGQPGMSHTCYYNPGAPWMLVLDRVPHHQALHAVLWPSICLSTGMVLWLGLWLGCYKIEVEDKYKYPRRTYGIGLHY